MTNSRFERVAANIEGKGRWTGVTQPVPWMLDSAQLAHGYPESRQGAGLRIVRWVSP